MASLMFWRRKLEMAAPLYLLQNLAWKNVFRIVLCFGLFTNVNADSSAGSLDITYNPGTSSYVSFKMPSSGSLGLLLPGFKHPSLLFPTPSEFTNSGPSPQIGEAVRQAAHVHNNAAHNVQQNGAHPQDKKLVPIDVPSAGLAARPHGSVQHSAIAPFVHHGSPDHSVHHQQQPSFRGLFEVPTPKIQHGRQFTTNFVDSSAHGLKHKNPFLTQNHVTNFEAQKQVVHHHTTVSPAHKPVVTRFPSHGVHHVASPQPGHHVASPQPVHHVASPQPVHHTLHPTPGPTLHPSPTPQGGFINFSPGFAHPSQPVHLASPAAPVQVHPATGPVHLATPGPEQTAGLPTATVNSLRATDLGGFSIDASGRITVGSESALIGNPPQPQGFLHQPNVHVPDAHHQLPESPVAQPVIPHSPTAPVRYGLDFSHFTGSTTTIKPFVSFGGRQTVSLAPELSSADNFLPTSPAPAAVPAPRPVHHRPEISVIHRGTPAPHVIHEAVPTQPAPLPPPQPNPPPPQQLTHQTQFGQSEPQRLIPQPVQGVAVPQAGPPAPILQQPVQALPQQHLQQGPNLANPLVTTQSLSNFAPTPGPASIPVQTTPLLLTPVTTTIPNQHQQPLQPTVVPVELGEPRRPLKVIPKHRIKQRVKLPFRPATQTAGKSRRPFPPYQRPPPRPSAPQTPQQDSQQQGQGPIYATPPPPPPAAPTQPPLRPFVPTVATSVVEPTTMIEYDPFIFSKDQIGNEDLEAIFNSVDEGLEDNQNFIPDLNSPTELPFPHLFTPVPLPLPPPPPGARLPPPPPPFPPPQPSTPLPDSDTLFPEYDAVPDDILLQDIIPKRARKERARKKVRVGRRRKVVVNKMFDTPRNKRRMDEDNKDCKSSHKKKSVLFMMTFSGCWDSNYECGVDAKNATEIHNLGNCLVNRYPKTKSLNLAETLSSGHGSVSLESDEECGAFLKSYFPICASYIPSCEKVGTADDREANAIGCLFTQYPSLMIPLLSVNNDLNRV